MAILTAFQRQQLDLAFERILRGPGGLASRALGDFSVADALSAFGSVNNGTGQVLITSYSTIAPAMVMNNFTNVVSGELISFQNAGVEVANLDHNGVFTSTNINGSVTGTNTGDVTLGAVGSSPNVNSASLSGQILTLQPADSTHPGILTTLSQTIGGNKTFTGNVTVQGTLTASAGIILDLSSIWNSGNLLNLGAFQFWFDQSNQLRVKSGTPSFASDGAYVDNKTVTVMTDGARNAGQAVYITGQSTLSDGTVVPIVSPVSGLSKLVANVIGVLIDTTSGAALARVRTGGLMTELNVNTTGRQIGDKVYVSDSITGVLNSGFSFVSGTFTTLLGYVASVGLSGHVHVQVSTKPLGRIDVTDYGVKADALYTSSGAITASQTLFTWTGGSFAPSDVGKAIKIPGAGSAGADLVTTIATYVSATQVNLTLAASVSVSGVNFTFGTDNTPLMNGQLATAVTNRSIELIDIGGALASFSGPEIFFPDGEYAITGPITFGLQTTGSRSILRQFTPTASVFSGFTSDGPWTVSGLTFRGGKDVININTGNISGVHISILDCQFEGWDDGASIKCQAPGGTLLLIENCDFIPSTDNLKTTLSCVNSQECDGLFMKNCSVLSPVNGDFMISGDPNVPGSGSVTHLENVSGVPGGVWTTGVFGGYPVWCRLWGGILRVNSCRFGGEPGARPAFANHGAGEIKIVDTAVFTALGNSLTIANATYVFYALPGQCVLTDNIGNGFGAWFDTSIPNADVQNFATSPFNIDGFRDGGVFGNYGGSPVTRFGVSSNTATALDNADVATRTAMFGTRLQRSQVAPLAASDLVRVVVDLQTNTNDYNKNGGSINAGSSETANIFGAPVRRNFPLSAGPTNEIFDNLLNGLKHLPNGTYTVAWDLTNNGSHVMNIDLHSGETQSTGLQLEPGHHIITRYINISPVTLAGPLNPTDLGWFYVCPFVDDQFDLGPIKIFKGRVTPAQVNNSLWNSSVPNFGVWFTGDIINNPQPAPGGSMGWVCTTSGALFSDFWRTSTAYTLGQCVINHANGNIYQVVVQGTSASGGTGPINSFAGVDITDGGITWWQIGSITAVFTPIPGPANHALLTDGSGGNHGVLKLWDPTAGAYKYISIDAGSIVVSDILPT